PRSTRAQPAGGRTADATLQLGLTRVERIAERRIPRELVSRDRMQLEQTAQERPSVVARQVAALDQRNRVGEVGQRQPGREPGAVRALRGVRGDDQPPRGVAAEPPATSQFLRLHYLAGDLSASSLS